MQTKALHVWLDKLLKPDNYSDYCPNGLQVEGGDQLDLIVTAVTASQAAIEHAVACGAQALLVHHGLFWRGDGAPVVGMLKQRLSLLLAHDINLFAYHLPLDCHTEFGNNAEMARALLWQIHGDMCFNGVAGLGCWSELAEVVEPEQLRQDLHEVIKQKPQFYSGGQHAIKRVGWCTGAAQDGIVKASELGLDAYISGEVSERTVYQARELGIHYFAVGHHASERFGVRILGDHIASAHGIEHQFFDDDNPV